MLHFLLAQIIARQVPGARLVGDGLPFWNLTLPDAADDDPASAQREIIDLYGHVIPFQDAITRLGASDNIEIRTRSLAFRMEYFGHHLDFARELFQPGKNAPTGFGDDHVVFAIRTGNIYRGQHANYTLLPIAFYEHIVRECGRRPAFVGQIEDNEYCAALRGRFPQAPFFHGTPAEDFHMIRTSSRIVLSVSTFAWLAAWLSETAREIILPVIGLYNPYDRPDIDALPVCDPRYRFYLFPRERWSGTDEEIASKILGRGSFESITAPRLFRIMAALSAWSEGRLPQGLPLSRALRPAFSW